MKPPDS